MPMKVGILMNYAIDKEHESGPSDEAHEKTSLDAAAVDVQTALALKNIFFFFALAFRYPDERIYSELVTHMAAFSAFFKKYAGAAPSIPPLIDLQAEYVSLFVNNKGFVPATLYVSTYLGHGQLMGEAYFKLKQIMAESGFMMDDSIAELEDHLSVLLEFNASQLNVLIEKNADDIDSAQKIIERLLKINCRYIGGFINLFSDAVKLHASFDFYKVAARALQRFIKTTDDIFAQLIPLICD